MSNSVVWGGGQNVNSLPVLFAESGLERQIGWYKLSNGKRIPLYEWSHSYSGNFSGADRVVGTMPNYSSVKNIINMVGSCRYYNAKLYMSLNLAHPADYGAWNVSVTINASGGITLHIGGSTGIVNDVFIMIQYTKTTDTPID